MTSLTGDSLLARLCTMLLCHTLAQRTQTETSKLCYGINRYHCHAGCRFPHVLCYMCCIRLMLSVTESVTSGLYTQCLAQAVCMPLCQAAAFHVCQTDWQTCCLTATRCHHATVMCLSVYWSVCRSSTLIIVMHTHKDTDNMCFCIHQQCRQSCL